MIDEKKPTPEALRNQLERILQNAKFRGSDKQSKFLSFVVNETLEDRASQIKAYTIAVAVYERAETFDSQIDPIVRVEAGRLRRALEHYYLTAGKNDPVIIKIPKGSYVPTFQTIEKQPSQPIAPISEDKDSKSRMVPTIAVMPLLNLSGDEEQDYFIDGLTEELTTELARYQGFKVIASQSTMRFKGQVFDSSKIRNDLGVDFFLTGSIRKSKKTLKVMIQVVDASIDMKIWVKSYKRDLTAYDLIAIQEEIAQSVVGSIADQYGFITRKLSKEARKKAPVDLKAYDAILRFYHYETVLTPPAFEDAMTALELAIKLDPEYGLAWAMLAHLHADNYALGFREIEAPLEKALTFAQKGVALAPGNQFVHDALTLVHFHRGNKKLFLKSVEETIALNPNSPYIIGVAGWHMALYGEWERGLDLLKKGIKLNPYYPSWFHLVTFMDYYRRGENENAFAEALKFNYPELFWDPLMRAVALSQMGRKSEAKTAVSQLLKLEPDFATQGRYLISRYVKIDTLIDEIVKGLQKAGLKDLK
ncbi:MAG: tetratricopeptide repeat protein [Desulfobacterales bacterium]